MANQVPAPIAVLSVSAFVDKLRESGLGKVAWAVEVTARQLMRKLHGHDWRRKLTNEPRTSDQALFECDEWNERED